MQKRQQTIDEMLGVAGPATKEVEVKELKPGSVRS